MLAHQRGDALAPRDGRDRIATVAHVSARSVVVGLEVVGADDVPGARILRDEDLVRGPHPPAPRVFLRNVARACIGLTGSKDRLEDCPHAGPVVAFEGSDPHLEFSQQWWLTGPPNAARPNWRARAAMRGIRPVEAEGGQVPSAGRMTSKSR